jgi:Rhs element Vgr protein
VDAEWLQSQLARTSGRIKCEGVGTVQPGDVVALSGVGDRFSGNVFVTGVRHDYDLVQGWKTHLQFGSVAGAAAASPRAPQKASGLVPGVSGLQLGVVVSNEDPTGAHRVRVRMPLMSPDADGAWARVSAVDAGDDRGLFIRPEIGDEVVLGFLHDDPRHPVILGMLHSSAHAAPLSGTDDNHEKLYQTRSKLKLYFNDDTKVLRLETPAGNSIALDEDAKAIKIEDQHGNKIEMTSSGIVIESATALELKAGTAVKVESSTSLEMKSGSTLKLEGAAGAELTSSAITKVRGSLLQLN